MRGLLKRHQLIGWAFFAIGYLLIHWHHVAIDDLLHARAYSLLLFPHHQAAQYFFMGFFILALLPAAGLCFVTAWGVGHQRAWSRRTGLMPCLYLMLGFPYLTAVGGLALYFLWTQPMVGRRTLSGAEFWDSRRQSGWMLTASIFGWFVARLAYSGLQVRANRAGLPEFDTEGPGIIVFLFLMWIHVALHECGHALAAVWVGFRVKVLAIGPLVFSKEPSAPRVRFEWRGLLLPAGYMGAIPDSAHRFRVRQMIVIAAGPFTSLAAGGVLFGISFLLPGTALANLWPMVAMGAVAGFYIGATNLLPLGYCDGTMLFHLLRRTRRGKELTALILRGANLSTEQLAHDYEDDVSQQRDMLQQLLDSRAPDPVQLARQHIELGTTEIGAGHLRDAELHVTQGLALLPEGTAPACERAAWECLQILRAGRWDHTGAAEAYGKAVTAARRLRNQTPDPEPLQAAIGLAMLHVRAHAWAPALEETAAALALCPEKGEWRLPRGMLLACRTAALLQTGRVEAGLEAADRAAGIFREQSTGVRGPHHLGLMGESLWEAGRTKEAITLDTECIMLLEARGAFRVAATFRLRLAEVLRCDGSPARAACVLPRLEWVGSDLRRRYHAQRGAIRQSGGKLPEAIADLSETVAISEREMPRDEVTLATVRCSLADALAEAGDLEQAERLARQAQEVLASANHPHFAATCITLAVIGWRKDGSTGGYVEAALRGWNTAPLLLPVEKARALEGAAESLASAGLTAEASECRTAAERYRESLATAPPQEALVTS